ncbi:MAG: rod shape-determining protein MreD [bacterium]|nr:MAG: rod shape-determining protein MreD [bacterium]
MYVLRIVLIALIFLVLQMTVIHHIAIGGVAPDLMIILLVALVLDRGPVAAVAIGFCLGFLQDLGNADFLGMNALAKSIIAYGVSRIGIGLFPESSLFRGVLILLAVLINDIISLIIITSFTITDMLASFFRYSLLSALYTAVVGVVVLGFVGATTRRVVSRRGGY